MKIRPVGAELFYADGRTDGPTDMTKLIVAFYKFANAPKLHLIFYWYRKKNRGSVCSYECPVIVHRFLNRTVHYSIN